MVFDENFFVLVPTILFILLAFRPAKKHLGIFLDERSAKIAAQINEAAQLKADAQAALLKAQKQQREMDAQTKLIVEQAKSEIETLQREAKENLEETLRRKEQAAFARIASMEREAVKQVQNMVSEVTFKVVKKVLESHLPAQVSQQLITGAIQHLPQELKRGTLH